MTVSTNVQGVVLRSHPIRERDRLYTLFTKDLGKVVVHAVGTRKISSKLAGSMEPYGIVECMLIKAKRWPKLGGAVVQKRYKYLTRSAKHIEAAQFVCSVVESTTTETHPDEEQYTALLEVLEWLDAHDAHPFIVQAFVVKWARIFGSDLRALAGDSVELQKITQWLATASYDDIARLRLSDAQWRSVVRSTEIWIEDNGVRRVHMSRVLL